MLVIVDFNNAKLAHASLLSLRNEISVLELTSSACSWFLSATPQSFIRFACSRFPRTGTTVILIRNILMIVDCTVNVLVLTSKSDHLSHNRIELALFWISLEFIRTHY
jgi:hypothetical protein